MRTLLSIALLALPSLAGAQGAHRELIDKGEHTRALARLEKDLAKDPANAAALYSLAHLQDLPTYAGRDVEQAYATVLRAAQAIAAADARALERWARDGVNAGAVQDLRELIVAHALQQTLQRNTMDACRAFLRTYAAEPATVLDQARARLAQLAYVDARNANTIAAYEQFLRDHPGAGEGADARERIAILAFDALAGSAGSAPYRDYLARHPAGPRTAQARAERERWEFRENARPGDAQGYVDYIRNNPTSAALQEARDSLRAAGGPPEGYQFRRTTAPPGEHHYVDELRGLVLVNVGGKRYTDLGCPLYTDEDGNTYRKPLDPPGIPLDLQNGVTYQGGFAGLDFGFSRQALKGDPGDRPEIIVGGKWRLLGPDGTMIIPDEHDDIYPVDDLFCACNGGTFKKTWNENAIGGGGDQNNVLIYDEIIISKGNCSIFNEKGNILKNYGNYNLVKNPVYFAVTCLNIVPPDRSEITKEKIILKNNYYTYFSGSKEFDYLDYDDESFYLETKSESAQVYQIDSIATYTKGAEFKFISDVFENGRFVLDQRGLGYVDKDMRTLVPPVYGTIASTEVPYLYMVSYTRDDYSPYGGGCMIGEIPGAPYWRIYNSKLQKEIISYDVGYLVIDSLNSLLFIPAENSNLVGAYDFFGREIIPQIFDEISPLGDGLFALGKGTKWGLTNAKGDKLLLLEHTFEEVERKAARFR